jgi:hypothetical protein
MRVAGIPGSGIASRTMWETCERCGNDADELVTIRHRNGEEREVCPDCADAAYEGDALFWKWFHHPDEAYVPDRDEDGDEEDDLW